MRPLRKEHQRTRLYIDDGIGSVAPQHVQSFFAEWRERLHLVGAGLKAAKCTMYCATEAVKQAVIDAGVPEGVRFVSVAKACNVPVAGAPAEKSHEANRGGQEVEKGGWGRRATGYY